MQPFTADHTDLDTEFIIRSIMVSATIIRWCNLGIIKFRHLSLSTVAHSNTWFGSPCNAIILQELPTGSLLLSVVFDSNLCVLLKLMIFRILSNRIKFFFVRHKRWTQTVVDKIISWVKCSSWSEAFHCVPSSNMLCCPKHDLWLEDYEGI